jgi:hypothetical protein
MYKDESGRSDADDKAPKDKLKEYQERLKRIESGTGLVGSDDLNSDDIPVKPPPKGDATTE